MRLKVAYLKPLGVPKHPIVPLAANCMWHADLDVAGLGSSTHKPHHIGNSVTIPPWLSDVQLLMSPI